MFIEVTEKDFDERVTINVNAIICIFPLYDGSRIYLNGDSLHQIEIKESYEDVKRCLVEAMRQLSKRVIIS